MDNDAVRLMAGALTGYALNFSSAVAILIVGWLAAGWVRRGIAGTLDRVPRMDATLKPIIANMGRYGVLILVVIAVLARFGVQTASVITILGAGALAIGLALQGTLSNIAAGFMLLLLRPFRVGEYIDAEGIAGTVSEVGLFTTQLKTFDGVFVSAPNSKLWNSTIRNYSRLPSRRVDLAVGVGYADDIEKGMSVLLDLLKGDSRVLAEPAPEVMVTALGESAVNLNMRCWVGRGDYWAVLYDITQGAKAALETAGLTIPFPQRDVHLHRSDDSPENP